MPLRISVSGDDPFASTIATMAEVEFPGSAKKGSQEVFEAVSKELIGTKQHRLGPTPDPESLVEIRKVVRWAMDRDRPIPILVPWGASKQGPWKVDVAEVMALKQLDCLDRRVSSHYSPGIEARIRLEDLTDEVMFTIYPEWQQKTDEYVLTMENLHKILASGFSEIAFESEMMDRRLHVQHVTNNAVHILEAMTHTEADRGKFLRTRIPEWRGDLPDDQLNFYRRAYDAFYPNESADNKNDRLAGYFAGAITRFQLGGTGAREQWEGNYVTLAFTGIPWGKAGRRIYYRTIPERYTNQHRAPWIGKGYVRIRGREATPAISGWNGDGLEFVPASLIFDDGQTSATVSADYVVVE